MQSVLILLPIGFLAVTWLHFMGRSESRRQAVEGWERSLLMAATLWGALLALIPEVLGAVSAVSAASLTGAWALADLSVLTLALKGGFLVRGWKRIRSMSLPATAGEWIILAGISVIVGLLLVLAVISPVNNVDALNYHLARVAHWAQNRSLDHFAAAYHPQNFYPLWAEVAILHLRLLWGSDQLSGLVQWLCMVLSLAGVTGLANLLGAGRKEQLLAAAFAVTIPIGILQSTGAQNDYAVAWWAVALAYFVLASWRDQPVRPRWLWVGLATALGILTKPTFVAFAAPLIVLFLILEWRRAGLLSLAVNGLLIAVAIALLNSGLWLRNLKTYGGLYGGRERDSSELAFVRAWGQSYGVSAGTAPGNDGLSAPDDWARYPIAAGKMTLWAGRSLARFASLNLVTPSRWLNELLWWPLRELPALFGDIEGEALQNSAWSHEDTAGNPIHLFAVPASLALVALNKRLENRRGVLIYACTILSGYVMLPIVFGLAGSPYGVRFQLPFFVVWAPVVALSLSNWQSSNRLVLAGGLLLLLSSLPYLLFNNTRPVIGRPPWPTRTHSVFSAPSEEIAFAANLNLLDPYKSTTEQIEGAGCRRVGLRIDSGDLEYLFWWLLGAPESGYELEVVDTYELLEPLLREDFTPCAIICTNCGDRVSLAELPLVSSYGIVKLFMAP